MAARKAADRVALTSPKGTRATVSASLADKLKAQGWKATPKSKTDK